MDGGVDGGRRRLGGGAALVSLAAIAGSVALGGCGGECDEGQGCAGSVESVSNYKGVQGCSFVPLDRFVDAAVQAWCTPRPECEGGGRPGNRFSRAATCRAWVRENLLAPHGLEALVAASQKKHLSYAPEKACACLSVILQSCAQADFMLVDISCHETFRGVLADGNGCRWDQECAGGFCRLGGGPFSSSCPGVCTPAVGLGDDCDLKQGCGVGLQCVAGRCVPLGLGPAGETCGASGCEAGQYCDWASGVVCKARLKKGESCQQGAGSCLEGLYCAPDPDPTRAGRRCALPYAAGSVCALDGGPGVETCVTGAVCAAGKCRPRVGVDAPCERDAQCPDDATCTEGTCRPVPGVGDKCDPSRKSVAGYVCQPPLPCDPKTHRCVSLPGDGAACVQGRCAAGLECVQGQCAAPPGRGQPCATAARPCAEGLVCVLGVCEPEACK